MNTGDVKVCDFQTLHFRHEKFKVLSKFDQKSNPPQAVMGMTMVNELELANVNVDNPFPQNLTRSERQGLK